VKKFAPQWRDPCQTLCPQDWRGKPGKQQPVRAGEEKMKTKEIARHPREVTKHDYRNFKKLLEFFVSQANKNAKNSKIEESFNSKEHPNFIKDYNLDEDYNKIAGLGFIVRFAQTWEPENFGKVRSTYINIGRMNIVGDFPNQQRHIEMLKNEFVVFEDERKVEISEHDKQKVKERNSSCKPYSLDDNGLGLFNGKEPNDNLKKFLNEYIEMYEEFPKFP
jgi:hypothetical protein